MHEKILELKRFLDYGSKSYKLQIKVFLLFLKNTSKKTNLIFSQKEGFFESYNKFEKSSINVFHNNCNIPSGIMNDGTNAIQLHFETFERIHLLNIPCIVLLKFLDKERKYKYIGKVIGAVRPKLKWLIK